MEKSNKTISYYGKVKSKVTKLLKKMEKEVKFKTEKPLKPRFSDLFDLIMQDPAQKFLK